MSKKEKTLIDEINALAYKSKNGGLNEEEKSKQKRLREEYLSMFRAQFKQQLHSIKVVDENGQDVTPEKLKRAKEKMS